MLEKAYTYVWLRKDLQPVHAIIQAGHALHEIGLDSRRLAKANHMVLFEVPNEKVLFEVEKELSWLGIRHHLFYEPDYGMGYTAIASEAFCENDPIRKRFSRWPLYKDS